MARAHRPSGRDAAPLRSCHAARGALRRGRPQRARGQPVGQRLPGARGAKREPPAGRREPGAVRARPVRPQGRGRRQPNHQRRGQRGGEGFRDLRSRP
eukprot:4478344-Alexandrium_andersonii.AAC.1